MTKIFDTNEWLHTAPVFHEGGPRLRAVCASGLSLSIQASHFHYCSPKNSTAERYDSVEVGFPERGGKRARLRTVNFQDGGVAGWVPVETLNRVLKRNGGIVAYQKAYSHVVVPL